jgi:hypothetical protein
MEMSEDHEPRLFPDDQAVRHIGEGLLACTLTRSGWTHEAHLAACLWSSWTRPTSSRSATSPTSSAAFNESVGGVNDGTQGYHETITSPSYEGCASICGVREGARWWTW